MGAERPSKTFEFKLLEKALKVLPSHFKVEQNFIFCFLFFWGTRVWVPVPLSRYQSPTGYVTVYINSSLFLVRCFILYLIKAKRVYMFGKFHFPNVACHGNCYSSWRSVSFPG